MASKVRLERDPPSAAVVAKAKSELRETPELTKESFEKLKELLKKDETIYYGDDIDNLLIYLRPTKFYPDSAYALMRRVAEFKDKHKGILENLMPEDEKHILLNEDVINVLVDRDQEGRRILILKCGSAWNPSRVNSDQVFRMLFLIHLAACLEPETQISGVVVILDFHGLGMKQVTALSPSFSMKLLGFIQEAMPLRLKGVHIVNQPFIFNMVWQIFKPLIKEKLKKRLFFHGDKMKSLHEHVKPEYLPSDYGGKLPKIDYSSKDWYPVLQSAEDFIKANNTYGLVKKV